MRRKKPKITKLIPIPFFVGLCVDTVDFIKKYVYHRRRDYYEAELVLKFWEYYGNDASPLQLEPCTWAKLVDLLKQLDRYDVADRLIYQRQQRQWSLASAAQTWISNSMHYEVWNEITY